MSTARLFIALWPNPATRAELARRRDAWSWPRAATPVKSERLHVTLHFLGDIERARIPELADALSLPFEQFTLKISQAVLWPHGIAVLEPPAPPVELFHLHERLARVLAAESVPVDARPYRPHVTLARRANGATVPAADPPMSWHVTGYRLMESTTGPEGAYTTLRAFPD